MLHLEITKNITKSNTVKYERNYSSRRFWNKITSINIS